MQQSSTTALFFDLQLSFTVLEEYDEDNNNNHNNRLHQKKALHDQDPPSRIVPLLKALEVSKTQSRTQQVAHTYGMYAYVNHKYIIVQKQILIFFRTI